YAVNIAGFDLGVTGKYIAMTIKTTATTFAFDGGLIKKFYISGVNAALSLTGRNFGFPVSFGSVTETLPRSVNLGLAFEFGRDFILSGEASFPWDNKLFYMTGAEYTIRAQKDLNFKIRSGYNTRSAESGELGGFAVGLGLGNSEYSMDYAFVPLGSLGYTHRMSFSVAFGKGEYFPEQTKKYILNEGAAKRKEVEALKEQKQDMTVEETAPKKNSIVKESSQPDSFAEFVKKTLEESKKASSPGAEKMKGGKTEENRKAPVLESLGAEKMKGSNLVAVLQGGSFMNYVLIGFGILFVMVVFLFNFLIVKKNQVKNAFAAVDALLKKRYDLIPNLVEAVKGYVKHERTLLTELARLRSEALSGQKSGKEKEGIDNKMGNTLKSIMAVSESYPELKASDNFIHLQKTLNEVEEQISAGRRAYNASVNDYNNAVMMFPSNIVAGILGFKEGDYFSITEKGRENINVTKRFKK
ncbi:MAG: LemA family protein, partial [Candidatus Firestonebacteria bacterium]